MNPGKSFFFDLVSIFSDLRSILLRIRNSKKPLFFKTDQTNKITLKGLLNDISSTSYIRVSVKDFSIAAFCFCFIFQCLAHPKSFILAR